MGGKTMAAVALAEPGATLMIISKCAASALTNVLCQFLTSQKLKLWLWRPSVVQALNSGCWRKPNHLPQQRDTCADRLSAKAAKLSGGHSFISMSFMCQSPTKKVICKSFSPSPSLSLLTLQFGMVKGKGEGSGGVRQQVFFSTVNKISAFSLERRVDFHLQRIMKRNRLINFKNSIEGLSIEERIFESLLEIIISSNSLISRRQSMIIIGSNILNEINAFLKAGEVEAAYGFLFSDASGAIALLKHISSSLGQLMWALNSNKEHVKYVIKVFALPEIYIRNGGVVGDHQQSVQKSSRGLREASEDFGVCVQLKERIAEMVAFAEETIDRCEELKASMHDALLGVFLAMSAIEEVYGGFCV